MKKTYLLLSLLFLVACNNNVSSSSSESSKISSSSSSSYITSSSTNSSTNKIILVENINFEILNDVIYPNDKIEYRTIIYPNDASNTSFKLSTSTPDILEVNGMNVLALDNGKGKLTITSEDGNFSNTIDVLVSRINSYSEIIELLDRYIEVEKEEAVLESYEYTYKNENTIMENRYIDYLLFDDAIQKEEQQVIQENSTTTKSLTYIENDNVNILKVINEESVDLNKIPIGEASNCVSMEEANIMTSYVEYNGIYGMGNYIKSLLLDTNSFYMEGMEDNISIDVDTYENYYEYSIESYSYYYRSSIDEVESKMKIQASLKFNNSNLFEEMTYNIYRYFPNANGAIDEINYSTLESANISIHNVSISGDDVLSTYQKMDINDYIVSSFEINAEPLKDEQGVNSLKVGEVVTLDLVEYPQLHLQEEYRIEIEDTSIIEQGSAPLEIRGVNVGTTNIKVISKTGIEREISITVKSTTVESISLGYIPYLVKVDDSFKITAACYPTSASDVSYTIALNEGDEDKASLTNNNNGEYTFVALKEGTVTIVAFSNQNPEIKDTKTINIQKKPDLNSIEETLCSKTYTCYSSELKFNSDRTGSLKLDGGGEYTFSWELSSDLYFTFTNINTITEPDRWYDFKGHSGSMTDKNGSIINLYVWDLDYDETVSLQFV